MLHKLSLAFGVLLVSNLLIGCAPSSTSIQTAIAQTQIALPTPTTTSTVALPSPVFVSPPITNSVYFGKAEGKNVVYVTENHRQDLLKNLGFETSPYLGQLFYGVGYQSDIFNFKDLEIPQLLFTIPNLNQWHEIKYNLDQPDRKYISGTSNSPPDLESFVYIVNMDTGEFQEIWKWIGFPAHIRYVHDKYLEIEVSWCYACDYYSPPTTIIVNTLSGKTLELGEVGNVSLDLDNSTVSFQNLTPIEAVCEADTPCIGTLYEPSGEIFVESLP